MINRGAIGLSRKPRVLSDIDSRTPAKVSRLVAPSYMNNCAWTKSKRYSLLWGSAIVRDRANVSWTGGDWETTARTLSFSVAARRVDHIPPKLLPYITTRLLSTPGLSKT